MCVFLVCCVVFFCFFFLLKHLYFLKFCSCTKEICLSMARLLSLFVKSTVWQVKGTGFLSDANSWWVDSNWKCLYELLDVFGTKEGWM